MKDSGTLDEKYMDKIGANDLVIGINADSQEVIDKAIEILNQQFENKQAITGDRLPFGLKILMLQ